MVDPRDLNERERMILQAVVHSYITTAEPVGSRSVVKRFGLDLSPATVRNAMADLEELGFLEQLHTSSGRVPTDVGYRYYVNHLMRVQELTLSERERIEQEYTERLNDADEVLQHTSHLLALITHQAGIAEVPSGHKALVNHIELMPTGSERVAVLIADNFGRVHSMTVHVPDPISGDELPKLSHFLNSHLTGESVENLATAVQNKLKGFLDEQRLLAEHALRLLSLIPAEHHGQLYLEGATQLFEQPEFKDMARAREVLGLFEEKDHLLDLLRQAAQNENVSGSTVIIGGIDSEKGLEGISLVAAPYQVDRESVGMVGVLGPRRMPYSRLTAIVEHTAGMVGRILTRLGK